MIGILIVSHGAFGEALIHSASHVLGKRPLQVQQLGVTVHDDPDAILPQAQELVRQLDGGDGVLVLTDILGATPSNIATRLLRPGKVEGLSGASLPMLIRRSSPCRPPRRAGRRGPPEFGRLQCREPKLKSSTSWDCTRAPRRSSRSSRGLSPPRCGCCATAGA